MKVEELVRQLQKQNQSSTIELFHEQYNGGGDEASFDEPVVFMSANGSLFLAAAHKRDALSYEVGLVCSISNCGE